MSSEAKPGAAPVETDQPKRKAFGHTFRMLNTIEMFERLAYFGIRAVVPLYIMQADEPGGLHLSAVHKGTIYAWWAVFQSFLPIVTGGIADRYGYKRVLAFAISMNIVGYVMMANFHNYLGFFAGVLVLATGTAFFKPSLQGSIAQNLTKENSSLGWGIFYWIVNVGAFAAPFISTIVLGKPHSLEGWQTLFYLCAGFTACNLLLLLTFKDVPSGADKTESTLAVLKRTIVNIFDPRLITWLLIMSCFWLMMYQLWDLHPNFITDWVDSEALAMHVPVEAWWEYGDRGIKQVPQQILLNLNAGLIILLMVPLSWAARKMRTLSAMLVGMSVATCGVLIAGLTGSGFILLLGIVFFSLGEMWTGPKKNEYLGLIAPPGKKGLYLGYVNIPVGVGLFVGSYLAGYVYDNWGEKATLALKELGSDSALVAKAAQAADWSDSLEMVPGLIGVERDQALGAVAERLGVETAVAGERLRDLYRSDRGQTINLGLMYLAGLDSYRDRIKVTEPDGLAAHVDEVPDWIGTKRFEVLETVRDHVNTARADGEKLGDGDVEAMLWERFGADPGVLNNLACEYLAQNTELLYDAVAKMTFHDPVEEIPDRVGIDRTKAFRGLSAAMGADDRAVEDALQNIRVESDRDHDRYYVYLASLDHVRFIAIARKQWKHDVFMTV